MTTTELPTDRRAVAGGVQTDSRPDHTPRATQTTVVRAAVPTLFDPTLSLAADILDDLERVKISNENRLRQMTRTEVDEDGIMRGFGLDEGHPDVARLASLVDSLAAAEHQAVLNLQRAMRRHPLGPWVKAQRGVGEKQAARLLAKIGDPAVRTVVHEDGTVTHEWRTVSQLWAYAGLHTLPAPGQATGDAHSRIVGGGDTNIAARRQKGVQANWSTPIKTRAWLVIQSTMKQLDPDCKTDTGIGNHSDDCQCSPYRVVIDKRRAHTATTHPEWTPGHSLADAQRIACKRFLSDLWREARRLHGFHDEA